MHEYLIMCLVPITEGFQVGVGFVCVCAFVCVCGCPYVIFLAVRWYVMLKVLSRLYATGRRGTRALCRSSAGLRLSAGTDSAAAATAATAPGKNGMSFVASERLLWHRGAAWKYAATGDCHFYSICTITCL